MGKRILLALAAAAVLSLPAAALATKFNTHVSANTAPDQDRIYGVVQSGDFACEKRREVRLYGPDFSGKRGAQGFRRYGETKTNRFGEYAFSAFFTITKQGNGGFPQGEYFVRALRKDFPDDVCRRADSNSVFIINNNNVD